MRAHEEVPTVAQREIGFATRPIPAARQLLRRTSFFDAYSDRIACPNGREFHVDVKVCRTRHLASSVRIHVESPEWRAKRRQQDQANQFVLTIRLPCTHGSRLQFARTESQGYDTWTRIINPL